MKKIILLLIAFNLIALCSCNDWLDATSRSEIRDDDHYSTINGFRQTLTGCYIGMVKEPLYGKYLSWHLIERLGNQFEPAGDHLSSSLDYDAQNYIYTNAKNINSFESIWNNAYNVIVNVNDALDNIEKRRAIFDDVNYHIIKGELLAIRAYLHFDLLRLYGYGNWENRAAELNSKLTIPYLKTVSKEQTPQLSGKETINLILDDLAESEALLKEYDPILGKYDAYFYDNVDRDGYFKNRTIHLNYYAVKGLQARVWLWEGSPESKEKALKAAEEIIEMVEKGGVDQETMKTKLKILTPDQIIKSHSSLGMEGLFSLNHPQIKDKIEKHIILGYKDSDTQAMYLRPENFNDIYETYDSEARKNIFERNLNPESSSKGYVPLKVYQNYMDDEKYYKFKITLLRIPEIYYIAAECYAKGSQQNLTKAMQMLNTVRMSRGIYDNLNNLNQEQIQNEIRKEYHKEFFSEGVMFYYYKRTGAEFVPHREELMSDAEYVLPYPELEIQAGRIQ